MSLEWLGFLMVFGGVWAAWSALYQFAIRHALVDGGRFRLFALRDELRTLAINGEVNPHSFPYQYLENKLCRLIRHARWLSLGSLIEYLGETNGPLRITQKFEESAPEKLKQLNRRAIDALLVVMVFNSPGWVLVILALYPIAQLFGWALKQWLEFKVALFSERDNIAFA